MFRKESSKARLISDTVADEHHSAFWNPMFPFQFGMLDNTETIRSAKMNLLVCFDGFTAYIIILTNFSFLRTEPQTVLSMSFNQALSRASMFL